MPIRLPIKPQQKRADPSAVEEYDELLELPFQR